MRGSYFETPDNITIITLKIDKPLSLRGSYFETSPYFEETATAIADKPLSLRGSYFETQFPHTQPRFLLYKPLSLRGSYFETDIYKVVRELIYINLSL